MSAAGALLVDRFLWSLLTTPPALTAPGGEDGKDTRVVLIPRFCETGEVVLVNLRTLESKSIKIAVEF